MSDTHTYEIIARIRTDFPTKFGIPRQSGLAEALQGRVEFLPKYRTMDALRGLEGFSHLWLIWEFSQSKREGWSPVVRPPRLGGNQKVGVFASRSPFRPNPFGLSLVRLQRIEESARGPILHVLGADLMDNTPILDIKPYLPYTESIPDARGGFGAALQADYLTVVFPEPLLARIPQDKRPALLAALKEDPRPAYQTDETREYGFLFAGFDVRFTVKNNVLTVFDVPKKY